MPKRKQSRKRKATTPASKPDDDSPIVQGGIYTRFRINGKVRDDFGNTSVPEDWRKVLDKWLEVYESYAIGRFGPRGTRHGEVEAAANESRQVLEVLKYVNWMRDALAAGTDPYILYGAMQAGHAMEKLFVLQHEGAADIGKRSRKRTDEMRSKRTEKFSASRKAIRDECKTRLKNNPGLKGKPTTVRNALYRHFLKNGKQQKGYSESAIYNHIQDLFDPEK